MGNRYICTTIVVQMENYSISLYHTNETIVQVNHGHNKKNIT